MSGEDDLDQKMQDFLTEAPPGYEDSVTAADYMAGNFGPHKPGGKAPVPTVSAGVSADQFGWRLRTPLIVDGKPLDRVDIRPMTLGDLDDWSTGVLSTSRALLARLTGLHEAVLKHLVWDDAEQVMARFMLVVPDAVLKGREDG